MSQTGSSPTGQSQEYKRHWRNLLLSTRYQLGFTVFVVVICAILMTRLGIWTLSRVREVTSVVETNEAYLKDPTAEVAHVRDRQRLVAELLVAAGSLVTIGLFLYGIKMTHRVAGPIHKVRGYLVKVRAGRFEPIYPLRKGDQLIVFYDHFREAHDALRGRQTKDVEVLRRVVAAAEASGGIDASREVAARLETLRVLLAKKEASLG